jgi:SAM-dependent methyltransferase
MSHDPSLSDKWTTEYSLGGIPSSTRTTPSNAVVWAVDELKKHNFPLRTAADIGCGKGRNSLYLTEQGMDVTAMDFTPNAIRAVNETAAARGLGNKIRALSHDVTENWPIADVSMDVIIDAFCFKHLAPYEARLTYRDNLLRTLRVRGHYMISFASIGDGYYGQYVVQRREVDGEPEYTVVDPANGIASTLFTRKHILQFFAPKLVLVAELHHTKPSTMHGTVYDRDTYALLFGRNLHAL